MKICLLVLTCLIVSTWSLTLGSKCTLSLGFVDTRREPTLKISRSPCADSIKTSDTDENDSHNDSDDYGF